MRGEQWEEVEAWRWQGKEEEIKDGMVSGEVERRGEWKKKEEVKKEEDEEMKIILKLLSYCSPSNWATIMSDNLQYHKVHWWHTGVSTSSCRCRRKVKVTLNGKHLFGVFYVMSQCELLHCDAVVLVFIYQLYSNPGNRFWIILYDEILL